MRGEKKKMMFSEFIERSKQVHGNKYDYSKVVFTGTTEKVCIICPEHGEFFQSPTQHMLGQGCPKCAHRGLTEEELIQGFRNVHGDYYDYSKVKLEKMNDKVCIICPEHGEFLQSPTKHLRGQGCPKCGKRNSGKKKRLTNEEFLKRAIEIGNGKYDFSETKYVRSVEKVKIKCKKHGYFSILPYDFLIGHGCPKCANQESVPENEIYNYLVNLVGDGNIIRRDRSILENGKEIDIFLPEYKVGIEYNGLKWHSEEFGKGKWYHLGKTNACLQKGIKLIQIFEDEYLFNKPLVLEKIKYSLRMNDDIKKIPARKCSIQETDFKSVSTFLIKNHIQGPAKSTIYLSACLKDEIVGVMTFTKNGKDVWILTRYATKLGTSCQGLASKMLKFFIKEKNPTEIKSFADRRWSFTGGNLYEKLGFNLDCIIPPDYHYVFKANPTKRIHKFNFRKGNILKNNMEEIHNTTESKLADKMGYAKIWDCGLYRYVWKREE